MGVNMGAEQVASLVESFDDNRDGKISLAEFSRHMALHLGESLGNQKLAESALPVPTVATAHAGTVATGRR